MLLIIKAALFARVDLAQAAQFFQDIATDVYACKT
jgi:hypothetical protein